MASSGGACKDEGLAKALGQATALFAGSAVLKLEGLKRDEAEQVTRYLRSNAPLKNALAALMYLHVEPSAPASGAALSPQQHLEQPGQTSGRAIYALVGEEQSCVPEAVQPVRYPRPADTTYVLVVPQWSGGRGRASPMVAGLLRMRNHCWQRMGRLCGWVVTKSTPLDLVRAFGGTKPPSARAAHSRKWANHAMDHLLEGLGGEGPTQDGAQWLIRLHVPSLLVLCWDKALFGLVRDSLAAMIRSCPGSTAGKMRHFEVPPAKQE